jgi:hypothetical protein
VNGRIQSAKRAHFQAFPQSTPSAMIVPIALLCRRWSRLISNYSLVRVLAGLLKLSAFQGLRGCESYVRAVQTGRAIPMQEFTADLKHRMRCLRRR